MPGDAAYITPPARQADGEPRVTSTHLYCAPRSYGAAEPLSAFRVYRRPPPSPEDRDARRGPSATYEAVGADSMRRVRRSSLAQVVRRRSPVLCAGEGRGRREEEEGQGFDSIQFGRSEVCRSRLGRAPHRREGYAAATRFQSYGAKSAVTSHLTNSPSELPHCAAELQEEIIYLLYTPSTLPLRCDPLTYLLIVFVFIVLFIDF